MRSFKITELESISSLPDSHGNKWLLDAERSVEFLQQNTISNEIVIYASTKCVLIHGVLALKRKLTPDTISKLQNCRIPMPDDSWCIQRAWGGGMGHRIYLEAPLASVSDFLSGGEKLIFRRDFTGVTRGAAPIEISQKLIHSLDIHYVPERNAYCRLDSKGDIEDVIKIIQKNQDSDWDSVDVVTIQRKELDKFMALSKTCLVLWFDFTRVNWGDFSGWGEIKRFKKNYPDLCYDGGIACQGSYCHGVMIVRPQVSVSELIREWKVEKDKTQQKYAVFKIYDRKNDINVETSCAPECLSNYFQESELPWEISPAFFRSEVSNYPKVIVYFSPKPASIANTSSFMSL